MLGLAWFVIGWAIRIGFGGGLDFYNAVMVGEHENWHLPRRCCLRHNQGQAGVLPNDAAGYGGALGLDGIFADGLLAE